GPNKHGSYRTSANEEVSEKARDAASTPRRSSTSVTTENHGVGGSTPPLATREIRHLHHQLLATYPFGCRLVATRGVAVSSRTSSTPLRFAGSHRPYVSAVSWMLACPSMRLR